MACLWDTHTYHIDKETGQTDVQSCSYPLHTFTCLFFPGTLTPRLLLMEMQCMKVRHSRHKGLEYRHESNCCGMPLRLNMMSGRRLVAVSVGGVGMPVKVKVQVHPGLKRF